MKITEKIEITNECNMELMKRYPDNYFDLAIVDPPYGIGVSEMNIGARKIKNKSCDNKGWDNNIPTDEYWNELYRVSKHQIVWGANYFNCFNGKNGAIIWHKNNPLPTSSDCEIASYSKHSKVAIYNKTWTNYVNDKQTNHPTEKPIQLYEWLLKNYAKEGEKVKVIRKQNGYEVGYIGTVTDFYIDAFSHVYYLDKGKSIQVGHLNAL